jgi:hypothetical protein
MLRCGALNRTTTGPVLGALVFNRLWRWPMVHWQSDALHFAKRRQGRSPRADRISALPVMS